MKKSSDLSLMVNKRELDFLTENDEKAFEYAKELGLISFAPPNCSYCRSLMRFERGVVRHGFNGRWRCRNSACNKTKSLYENTIFYKSKLSIKTIFDLIYCYSCGETLSRTSHETGIELANASIWFAKFRNNLLVYSDIFAENKIGGEGMTVEIDETHIYSRKNEQGRVLQGQKFWVVGAICRETKEVRVLITRVRSEIVLRRFILQNINLGTRICTDGWRGYINISHDGFIHCKVNHKKNFVDPNDPSIHTNNIERFWRSLKDYLPANSRLCHLRYKIKEFVYFYNNGIKKISEKFETLIAAIRHFYLIN